MKFLFNHCQECDTRIPWRKRAFFGNSYKPVICESCHAESVVAIYGSMSAYRSVTLSAAAKELSRDYGA